MIVELRLQYFIEKFFRIDLRSIRRFYGADLFRKSANSILFKILIVVHLGGMISLLENFCYIFRGRR